MNLVMFVFQDNKSLFLTQHSLASQQEANNYNYGNIGYSLQILIYALFI